MLKGNHQLVPQGTAADLFASFPLRPHQLLTVTYSANFCSVLLAAMTLSHCFNLFISLLSFFPTDCRIYFTHIIVSITGDIHHRHTLAVMKNGFFLDALSVTLCWDIPHLVWTRQATNVRKITPRKVFRLFYFNIFLFLPLMLRGFCYMWKFRIIMRF